MVDEEVRRVGKTKSEKYRELPKAEDGETSEEYKKSQRLKRQFARPIVKSMMTFIKI